MIARLWHGWTKAEKADQYATLLQSEILPAIHRVPGYLGSYLLRRTVPDGVEFVTLTFFESWEAVRTFAGSDPEQAVVPPSARALLLRFDQRSVHYEVLAKPE
jgi:heme-degrading monooxygenase HmoA